MKIHWLFWIALALVMSCGAGLVAQTPKAQIVGRVMDATGSVIPEVQITVRNQSTNETHTATSGAHGEFTFTYLMPGEYELVAEKMGFQKNVQRDLVLQVDQTARMDLKLDIGAVAEAITVEANAPLLNTENGSKGDVVTNDEITTMPLNGRSFADLGFLMAGVAETADGGSGSSYAINGARSDNTNFILDGFANQNSRKGNAQVSPPIEALQEFKLQTTGYSAEFGRLSGGVMNMALKTGGNALHGALFEFLRNDLFDARNFFDADKSKLRRNQFGATVNGPVVIPRLYNGRDRTFFLFSWESMRQINGSSRLTVTPTDLERSGDFSQTRDAAGNVIPLKDPLLSGSCTKLGQAACFQGNKIPLSRMDSIALNILPYFPSANTAGVANYRGGGNAETNLDNFVVKIDQFATMNDNVSFRFIHQNTNGSDPWGNSDTGLYGTRSTSPNMLIGLVYTRVLRPTLINEARVGLARNVFNGLSLNAGQDYATELGITGVATSGIAAGFPYVSVKGLTSIGDSYSYPRQSVVNNIEWADTVSWTHGAHTMKAGADVLRVQTFEPSNQYLRGSFSFQGKWTNVGLADFLLGYADQTQRQFGGASSNYLFSTQLGFFVQDDYRITQNLTLNLGARYEIFGPPTEKYGRMGNYVPSLDKIVVGSDEGVANFQQLIDSAKLTGKVVLASSVELPKSLINTNYKNIAPRVGFAWRPGGQSSFVIRGAYGMFYGNSVTEDVRNRMGNMYPFRMVQKFSRVSSNPAALTLSNPFPGSGTVDTATAAGYDPNPPSQNMQSWNLTVEKSFGENLAVEAGYVGTKGTHLGQRLNYNDAFYLPADASASKYWKVRPVSWLTSIYYYWFGGNSNYNAATLTLKSRSNRSLFYRFSYTYSKALDYGSQFVGSGNNGFGDHGPQDPRDVSSEYGRADFDTRHMFTVSAIYSLPFHANRLVSGWQIAATGRAYSGKPFTPSLANANTDNGEAIRPDRTGSGILDNPTANRWFDVADFAAIPTGSFRLGNSGRNILDGPGLIDENLSLIKNFNVRESQRLQIRWDVFNVTNHANFLFPERNIDVSTAGMITRARDARSMQLGMRYVF